MKKFLAILMAILMVLSMATVAFADGDPTPDPSAGSVPEIQSDDDMSTVTVKKVYKLIGEGTSPEETFTLVETSPVERTAPAGATAPNLGDITGASFAAGEATINGTTKNITISLPDASSFTKVGVYSYMLVEQNTQNNAGVGYYNKKIKLVITVLNDNEGKMRIAAVHTEDGYAGQGEAKKDSFENTYSAGTLNIEKYVDGNMGDKTAYFKFTVNLTGEGDKNYNTSGFSVSGGSDQRNPEKIYVGAETVFYLKHGEKISIGNIPYGVTYTVTEEAVSGYTTTAKIGNTDVDLTQGNPSGSIAAASTTVAYTNTKEGTPDTGVSLDTLPYVLVLALAGAGLVLMIARKRRVQD